MSAATQNQPEEELRCYIEQAMDKIIVHSNIEDMDEFILHMEEWNEDETNKIKCRAPITSSVPKTKIREALAGVVDKAGECEREIIIPGVSPGVDAPYIYGQIIASVANFVLAKQLLSQSAVKTELEQCWASGNLAIKYRKQIIKIRWTLRSRWSAPIYLILH